MAPAILVSTAFVLWSSIATLACPPLACAGVPPGRPVWRIGLPGAQAAAASVRGTRSRRPATRAQADPGGGPALATRASFLLMADPWLCALEPDWWQPVRRGQRLSRGCQIQALAALANLTGPAAACSRTRLGTLFALGFTTEQVLSLCAAARVRRAALAA